VPPVAPKMASFYRRLLFIHVNHLQVPTDIAVLVVPGRFHYKLSLRNVAEMFLTRGFTFTHETAPEWEERFAPLLTARLKARRRGKAGRK